MSRYGKSGWQKFWIALGVTLLVLLLIASVMSILYATVPAVKDFLINAWDWIVNLFSKPAETPTTDTTTTLNIRG